MFVIAPMKLVVLLNVLRRERGGRALPHAETPAGKASKTIGALVSGNLTKAMAQMTSFGVALMTEATVNTVTGMLRPYGDQLPNGFDHFTEGVGRTLTLHEVTHHLRMMGRGKGKDVSGWAPEHLCVALGHPDLGRELTNFRSLFFSGNLCDATQRALMLQTVTLLNEGTKGKTLPAGMRGYLSRNCSRCPCPR